MYDLLLPLAGLNVAFLLRNQFTKWYFRRFYQTGPCSHAGNSDTQIFLPAVMEGSLRTETARLGNNQPFAEYSLLFENIANPILRYSRFFFHGAAFLWNEKVFLFTGKSGVGKTTMLRNWLQLYPDEIEIINGDKPVIEQSGDDFIAHPSPWTGKEGWNGKKKGKLAGIICLEQGKTNHIFRLSKGNAVFPIFLQFLYNPTDEESVDLVCGYEQNLLDSIPVWKFINDGTPAAAELSYKVLKKEFF